MRKIFTVAFAVLALVLSCKEENPIIADFEASDTVILAGTKVTFTDLSKGGTIEWDWTFEGGTPSSSRLNFPEVSYDVPGKYDVILTVSNGDNRDTERKIGYIVVLGEVTADFELSESEIDAATAVSFMDISIGEPTAWEWSFPGGTPAVSTSQNPTVIYNTPGLYDVTLTASNELSSSTTTKLKELVVRGIVTHYKLDGNSNDSGPFNLTGVVHGATLTTDRHGVANAAYSFDGIDDYIEMPVNPLARDLPLTISFWVNFDEVSANILCIDYAHNQLSGVFFTTSKVVETFNQLGVNYGNGGGVNPTSRRTLVGHTLTTNQWYHIVGVIEDTNTMKAYVNGLQVIGSFTGTSTSYFHTGSPGALGKTGNPSDVFKGKLDDFRIYNKALSSSEIASIFEAE